SVSRLSRQRRSRRFAQLPDALDGPVPGPLGFGSAPIGTGCSATPQGMTAVPISNGCQALILTLQPDPPPTQTCDVLDSAPLEVLRYFALRMQHVRAANTKRLELRTQVDLRALFEPVLDLGLYEPY